MIQYWIFRIVTFMCQTIHQAIAYKLAVLVADVVFLLWREKRVVTIRNMEYVVGANASPAEARRLARQSFRNYGKYLVDFARFPRLSREDIERLVKFNQWEHYDRALEYGKGVIFIGLHMGNWDLGAACLAVKNYPLNVIAETFKSRKLNEHIQGTRTALGLKVIPMEQSARRVLRVLRQNELLGILVDRPSPDDGVEARFFGAKVYVPAGAAMLALRTGARIVPGCLVRQKDNTFLGLVEHHIEYKAVGDHEVDVRALTQRIMDSMEKMVRQYPDQWYMFRPMMGGEAYSSVGALSAS